MLSKVDTLDRGSCRTGDRVVVVGAGVGGLVTALLLGAAGCEVTVVEKAAGPGGKLREIAVEDGQRGGIDSGPTVLTMRWVFDAIFASVGARLDEELTLSRADILCRHAWRDGSTLDLHADEDETARAVAAFSGAADAAGYRAFCRRTEEVFETLNASFMEHPAPTPLSLTRAGGLGGLAALSRIQPFTPLSKIAATYFHDPRLRQLFGRYATYCGSSPFRAPAPLMLIAHVEQKGVWLVQGGLARLAEVLRRLAEEQGVKFQFGAEVAAIDVSGDQATGVRLRSGERLGAESVVFNGDPGAMFSGLLGNPMRRAVSPWAPKDRSLSALTWSIEGVADGFPLSHHNVFFSDNYTQEFNDILIHGRLPQDPTVYVCAQDRDASGGPAPTGPERLFILINAPATADTKPLSEAEIAACETRVTQRLAAAGLTISASSRARSVTTPGDFAAMFPGSGGALYGRSSHGWASSFQRPGARTRIKGLYLAGGAIHPGPGLPMAALSGTPCSLGGHGGFGFDRPVAPGGYAWWYLDAISADGQNALTVIAFVGSVFSPYYALARRRGDADPLNHVSINAILYTPRGKYWTLTERGRASLARSPSHIAIGPSALSFDGERLVVDIDEWTSPIPKRVRGRITVRTGPLVPDTFSIHGNHRHQWRPIAPCAAVDVTFDAPGLDWQGKAYLDMNAGSEPLEAGFKHWNWSRREDGGATRIHYDVTERGGAERSLALEYGSDGSSSSPAPCPLHALPRTGWRVKRSARELQGRPARVQRTLEDTPFYSRSMLAYEVDGRTTSSAIHESIDLDRFRTPWCQMMLPFKMPRWTG